MNKIFLPLLISFFVFTAPLSAQIKPSMKDPYIRREFQWSVFLHASLVKTYLNYRSSTLSPITKVSVTYRDDAAATKMYEEFYYSRGKVLGMHRRVALAPSNGAVGAIVLGGDLSDDEEASVNALMRVLVDLQLKHFVTAVVIVPQQNYSHVLSHLSNYGLTPRESPPTSGEQFNILIRSNPYGLEDRVFLSSR